MSRRSRTLIWGAVPVVLLTGLVSFESIPGTDISLTVPYAAEGPGPTFNTLGDVEGEEVVEISGAEIDEVAGNLNMTTVSVRSGMTLPQVIGRWLTTGDTLVPLEQVFPPNLSPEEVRESNEIAFSTSEAAATVAAMNYLGLPVQVEVAGVLEGVAAEGLVEPGDVILSVDGNEVSEPGQVRSAVLGKAPGESVALAIRRGEEEQTLDIELGEHPQDAAVGFLGITMSSASATGVEVEYNLEDIGGPSAGMMFSLAVVDKLSPGELNGGHFVAGTGTIDEDGGVGPIGGIVHKVAAAEDIGAEVFLAPSANCAEATSRGHGELIILKVDSLREAIDQMDAYANGGDYITCE
ncbi:Lon protease [Corynebacterium occultum]|uniref:endopeptidase La n=1 Tax=Corynebacterium occultum TaxID=2675219 RepID=A0A6B8VZB5_9CORY|nr:PDZ domain-containing protein [Corynebacterium occultum]QGU06664.1 Lon protease [Corynebacterium occultum]